MVEADIVVPELPLSECVKFWGKAARRLDVREIIDVLSVTGGVPRYLEEIAPLATANENIRMLGFRALSILRTDFDEMFADVIARQPTMSARIIRLLAVESHSAAELAKLMGIEKNGNISKALEQLEEAGLVSADEGRNPETGMELREKRFRLRDNYCRFYLKYIGDYPPAVCGYGECAERAKQWLFSQDSFKKFLETRDAANCGYWGLTYPSKMVAAILLALTAGEPGANDLETARVFADWIISLAEPADRPLAYFTPTYFKTNNAKRGVTDIYFGQTMLIYPAEVGKALVRLYMCTKDGKYLAHAKGIAETYLKLQGEDGTWPLKMWLESGKPVCPNRLVPIDCVTPFLEALYKVTGDARYRAAADRTFDFIRKGPLTTWNWEGQFEDAQPDEPYRNLTKHAAASTALYLLDRYPDDKEKLALARELLRFAEDQFVCWGKPFPDMPHWEHVQDVHRWITPCVLEQYYWYVPIDASASKLIRTYLALYRAEGNPLDLAKAKVLGDAMTRVQKPDGDIPTHWKGETSCSWWNCILADIEAMQELEKIHNAAV